MVCSTMLHIPISSDPSIQDTHGRTLCCNQRHPIFRISQREAHILRLARMLSLYCTPLLYCSPSHLTLPFRSVLSSLPSTACPCPVLLSSSLIPLLGPVEQTPSEISQFKLLFIAPGFLAYISVLIAIALSIIFYFGPKSVLPPPPLPLSHHISRQVWQEQHDLVHHRLQYDRWHQRQRHNRSWSCYRHHRHGV